MTTSTFAGSVAAASERCVRARTGTPASISRSTTTRPTRPVAPVTSTLVTPCTPTVGGEEPPGFIGLSRASVYVVSSPIPSDTTPTTSDSAPAYSSAINWLGFVTSRPAAERKNPAGIRIAAAQMPTLGEKSCDRVKFPRAWAKRSPMFARAGTGSERVTRRRGSHLRAGT